jgi:hypothetical protein
MLLRRGLIISCAAVLLTGCIDQAPLALSLRAVAGDYYLEQFEGGRYYLRAGRGDGRGGGVLDGTVERLAWTPRYILAQRRASAGGVVDGWILIDVERHTAVGPLTDDVVAARSALPRASEALTAAEAWKRLGVDWLRVLRMGAAALLTKICAGTGLRARS